MSETSFYRSARVLVGDALRPASVHVEGGRITRVADYHDVPPGAPLETTEHVLLPGIVDSHVHVNEPGRTEWEGFESATKAAAAGITTIVDMPLNSIPATTTESAVRRTSCRRSPSRGVWRRAFRRDHDTAYAAYQPHRFPLFCSASHVRSGAKYSRIALESAWRSPLRAAITSGQGLLAPRRSAARSFFPAAAFP